MLYTLFNKDTPVLTINYTPEHGFTKIQDILNPEFAPYGLKLKSEQRFGLSFKEWFKYRIIPPTRINYVKLKESIYPQRIIDLAMDNFALSLADQYWFCPEDVKDIHFADINFFQHPFTSDLNLDSLNLDLMNQDSSKANAQRLFSPNLTLNGNLPKKWLNIDGKIYLCKSSTEPFHQEAINELIASEILDKLKLDHVTYTYKDGLSYCQNFLDENTEFIPVWHIYNSKQKFNHESDYTFCRRLFDEFEIPYHKELDQMLLFDYLIANEDRHYNNFGFIRDVNTLKIIKIVPIFDNGCSLWYDRPDYEIGRQFKSKPFNQNFQKQLSYLADQSLLNLDFDASNIVQNILSKYAFPEKRTAKIADAVALRQSYLVNL